MSTYIVKLRTDSEVFADDPGQEIARILRYLADKIENDVCHQRMITLRDVNGNRIGYVQVRSTLHE